MPLYELTCSKCNTSSDMLLKVSARDELSEVVCPKCFEIGSLNRNVSAPLIGYSTYINGGGKPPEGFREVLRQIDKRAPGSMMTKTSAFL